MTEVNYNTTTAKLATSKQLLSDLNADVATESEGKLGRDAIDRARSCAVGTKSIYTYCFIAKDSLSSHLFGASMVIVGTIIQTVVPAGIVATLQPVDDIISDTTFEKICPNRSEAFTKILAFFLSLFFVLMTVSLCNTKLKGLAFLREFVWLGRWRRLHIDLGMLSQFIGMGAAAGAQFLLFVGNADASYIVMVLQSLALQFCLTVDQKLVSDALIGAWTSNRVAVLSAGPLLCGGAGVGEGDEPLPQVTAAKLHFIAKSEFAVLIGLSTFGLVWSIAVTYCV
mmetsp:Transcript_13406/g.15628  ORF Transcript_13406/g.15628 Transcript_13406/m.15628 type:complete len:283 (+) Transcript_13406:117-965(+)